MLQEHIDKALWKANEEIEQRLYYLMVAYPDARQFTVLRRPKAKSATEVAIEWQVLVGEHYAIPGGWGAWSERVNYVLTDASRKEFIRYFENKESPAPE